HPTTRALPSFPTRRSSDLLHEVRARADREERVLVTTLTKRMAEDLTEYYQQLGLRVRYLHSDIDTLDRVALIRDLRLGKFDCLIDRKSTRLNSSHLGISYA